MQWNRACIPLIASAVFYYGIITNVLAQCGDHLTGSLTDIREAIGTSHMLREKTIDVENRAVQIILADLDPDRMLFTYSEVEKLKKDPGNWSSGTEVCVFYNRLKTATKKAFERSQELIDKHTKQAYDFNREEYNDVPWLGEPKFCQTEAGLSGRWRKDLKAMTGLKMIYDADSAIENLTIADLGDETTEARCRTYVSDAARCGFAELVENEAELDKLLTELFLDAYARSYDPHSNYFSIRENTEFEQQLSKEYLSYGFLLSDEDESITIARIIPGGAAWKSNRLNEGDHIVKVTHRHKNLLSDPCMDAEELMREIAFEDEQKIELTVRKDNGTLSEVILWNELLTSEENLIKSYLLNGESKVGYIALPSFYTDFADVENPGCASDVAKEVMYLKREGIQGLILDLRNNGGGSMYEALSLSGIFIDEGPMCIIGDGIDEPYLMKDPNRGIIYDGPLVLIINELSASASELTASVLRDYNRAVIVGSKSYGKGTAQNIVPVGGYVDPRNPSTYGRETGYLKITNYAFYNLENGSHQGKGITPDIELPAVYAGFVKNESQKPNAIHPPVISKEVDFPALPELPVSELKQKSKARLNGNTVILSDIPNTMETLVHTYSMEKQPIRLSQLLETIQLVDQEGRQMKKLLYEGEGSYKAQNHSGDQMVLEFDEVAASMNEESLEHINGDVYLHEAFSVMNDLINLTE